MINSEILIAHSIFTNKGAFAILLGSGISRSAGIPTGWEILLQLIQRMAILEKVPGDTDILRWYQQEYKVEPNYSQVIEYITNSKEERLNLLRPFFESNISDSESSLKKPTEAHRSIARLIQKGYVKVVITTNFDRLMENALGELGIEASVISNANQIENTMPLIHSNITILKIHGDYLDTSFLNIESDLANYDLRWQELLRFVFENFGLITSGWSAKWDTALRQSLEFSNKFRFSNYFTFINSPEVELLEISNRRQGKLISIESADLFFKEVIENVEALERNFDNNPLNKTIALNRLKKYIQREDQKIELSDLITNELLRTYQNINEQLLPNPNNITVKNIIDFDISQMNLLKLLLLEGVFWGSNSHHEIWLKVVKKLACPNSKGNSYSIWIQLSFFPALISFYAIGLSALFKKNYSLLKELFAIQTSKYYNPRESGSILENVNIQSVIDPATLKEVLNTRQYVPMSELLFKIFKLEFDNWLIEEQEFNNLFDTFELLTNLKYAQHIPNNGVLGGRLVYNRDHANHIVATKLNDLNTQNEDLDWIKFGLFDNSETLKKYYTYFLENIKAFRFRL